MLPSHRRRQKKNDCLELSRMGIKKGEGRCTKKINRVRSRNEARKNEADDPSDISMRNVGPIGK